MNPSNAIDIESEPTWPDKCVDMRLKKNKQAFKAWRHTKHVKRICVSTSGFEGSRMAWEFSNELLAII